MALVVMLLLGWCLLSLPIGILVGNALRGPRARPVTQDAVAGPTPQHGSPQRPVAA